MPYRTAENNWGLDILNEMVKSYGFDRDPISGKWGWSTDNIKRQFQESPFWTTLDYLVWAVPVAKWGMAVRAVGKGGKAAGIVGAAYKTGRFSGRHARGFMGSIAGSLVGGEKAYAAQMLMRGPSRFLGGKLANPITTHLDDEWMKLADEFGDMMRPWERRGLEAVEKREALILQNWANIYSENLLKTFTRNTDYMGEEAQTAFLAQADQLLEMGYSPKHHLTLDFFDAIKDDRKRAALKKAYANTWGFRNMIHETSHALRLITDDAYMKNYQSWRPHIYEEFIKLDQQLHKAWKGVRPTKTGTGMVLGETQRFLPRVHQNTLTGLGIGGVEEIGHAPGLDMIFDIRATVKELSGAAQVVGKQLYAHRLAGSSIALTDDDLLYVVHQLFQHGPQGKLLRQVYGLKDDAVRKVRTLYQQNLDLAAKGYGDYSKVFAAGGEAAADKAGLINEMAEALGFKTLRNFMGGQKIPGYIQRLPAELKNKWIDPTIADDVLGTLKFMDEVPWLERIYKQTLSWFRITKTAYNPATHGRNYFGNIVFHHLATGGMPILFPYEGLNHWLDQDDVYDAYIASGLGGSTFTREVREALKQAFGTPMKKFGKEASGLEMIMPKALGGKKWAQFMERGASYMEEAYRAIDEVWKLSAFSKLRKRAMTKLAMSADEAAAWAAREVNTYMPTFMQHGAITNALRQHIPFFSFTTEAMRIWKNAMVNKPHLAFAWTHMGEMLSHAVGALQGFDGEEITAAVEGLPDYMNNKQLLMLPFKIDGKPYFMDLSYIIPLANMVEGEQADSSFFSEIVSLSANPFLSVIAAGLTGVDPFSQREAQPRFTERQLGIPVHGKATRRSIGLVEHALQLVLPPLAPPGYVGTNLLELARGQVHPQTNEQLEEGVVRTLAANFLGMRAYAPTVEAQVQNVRHEQAEVNEEVQHSWDRWQMAKANGDPDAMAREVDRLLALKRGEGHPDPEGYVVGGIERHMPGTFQNLSTKALEEIMARIAKIGPLSERDQRVQGELMMRYQARRRRRRQRRMGR